ncbi:MAG: hypothetical protein VX278_14660 [Myxococcota bacterium]|nr:hypothetical protein [Myxococcota bacterium]
MSYQAHYLVSHFREMHTQAEEILRAYQELSKDIEEGIVTIRKQLDEALLELAKNYVAELSPNSFERTKKLTGFQGFLRRDPLVAMERERVQLSNRIEKIRQDESYRKRMILVGEHGTLVAEFRERESFLKIWEQKCNVYERLPDFLSLIETMYDTPDFNVSWYQPRYWKLWAAGDRICEVLNMNDFGDDVLPAYREVEQQRAKWRIQVKDVQDKIDAVHQLVQTHDESVARLPRLPEIYLENCQALLAKHLEMADIPLLDVWRKSDAADDRGLESSLRKVACMKNKLLLLEKFHKEGVFPMLRSMQERSNKYRRKITKYRRPKYAHTRFPQSTLDTKFKGKRSKYLSKRTKAGKLVDRILVYDSYSRFSLENDPNFWWEEMTGKPPTSFTPSLRSWYDNHRSGSLIRDEQYQQSKIAMAKSQYIEDDLGYMS